jgi:hypothetical protein
MHRITPYSVLVSIFAVQRDQLQQSRDTFTLRIRNNVANRNYLSHCRDQAPKTGRALVECIGTNSRQIINKHDDRVTVTVLARHGTLTLSDGVLLAIESSIIG